jgi:DNA (cytosine-5)-methyltransferase 1
VTLTVGSLFSGVGGFELGLERAGMRCIWQSEIDPYASAVLRKHWPGVINHGDIRNIRAGTVEPADVLCGGFPCQDISNAGKRAGIGGERSGLWDEYARIIGEIRPRYVIVENVAALLGRGIERVLGDLAALGFDAEWHCIPASAVGAPHRRDRVWIMAHARREFAQSDRGFGWLAGAARAREGDGAQWWPRSKGPDGSGADMANADFPRLERWLGQSLREYAEQRIAWASGASMADATGQYGNGGDHNGGSDGESEPVSEFGNGGGAFRSSGSGWWFVEPNVGRVANGVSARVDRLKCLGNSIVPQVAEMIGRAVVEHAKGNPA